MAGGIHLPNLPQLLHGSTSPKHGNALDGIAVISDIVGSTDPARAAVELRTVLDSFRRGRQNPTKGVFRTEEDLDVRQMLDRVGMLLEVTKKETPLVNQV